jgi:hypothetical protein
MISVNDFNIVDALLKLEQRVLTLERTLISINNKNSGLPGFKSVTQAEFDGFILESGKEIVAKYPSLGLKMNSNG